MNLIKTRYLHIFVTFMGSKEFHCSFDKSLQCFQNHYNTHKMTYVGEHDSILMQFKVYAGHRLRKMYFRNTCVDNGLGLR